VPPGACDCHVHVLGPFDRFPLAEQRPYTPPAAPATALKAMLATMGLSRAVVAHVSAHGNDLSVTLDALAELGDRARATALLPHTVTHARLSELDRAGIRGIRLSSAYGSSTPIDEFQLRTWADRIAPLGWHIAMWPSSPAELLLLERLAPVLPASLVLDHLASHAWFVDGRVQADGLAVLDALMDSGKAWLKLSGMYRADAAGSPWPRLVAPMRQLLGRRADRLLWASDWPFVGLYAPASPPTTGSLLDWLQVLGADAATVQQVLVRNPEALYRFPAWT
jgi:predicted TIM-barrel fold metal-dependent hydrolase